MFQLKRIKVNNVKFLFFRSKRFVILKLKAAFYFIKLKSSIFVLRQKLEDFLKHRKRKSGLSSVTMLLSPNKMYKKSLVFKGLGLKARLDNKIQPKKLLLKLGFSHLCNICFKKKC